jgi:excisionase family DNA binding protein
MAEKSTAKPKPRTCSVPEAGKVLGVERKCAYRAAAKGEIATIRVGRKLRVPLAWLERKLEGADA